MGNHGHLWGHEPFWFGGEMGTLHKERRSVTQHDRDHTGSFTQVQATVRHKILLLLWWIDGGKWWENAALLPGKVASRRKWLRAYECAGV